MNLRSILKRSLACLLALATVFSLLPSVFATGAEEEAYDPIENMLLATLQEDGELTYEPAPESVKATVRATVSTQATRSLSNRMTPRVAIFIDPDCTEPSVYTAFTINETNIKNLRNRGVTDMFVMTKPRSGNFSTTHLNNVLQLLDANKWSNVTLYAWMHCARDDYYLKSKNTTAGQYHFRVGTDNIQNGKNTGVTGFVDLANSSYVTYFNGLVDKVEALKGDTNSYKVKGVLLDSAYFGTIYMGWGSAAQSAMGMTNWNAVIPHLVRTANTDGGGNWYYKANGSGYYVYNASSGTQPGSSVTKWAAYMDGNTTAAAVKSCFNYRTGVINTFIKNVKSKLGSGMYLAACTTPDWQDKMSTKAQLGIDPAGFGTTVDFAVAQTFFGQTSLYSDTNGNALPLSSTAVATAKSENTWPTDITKTIAKLGCNVMVGVDCNWSDKSSTYNRAHYQSTGWQAYYIHKSRFEINGDPNYGGDILGAALMSAGGMSIVQVSISSMASATPYVEFIYLNGNDYTMATHLIRFDRHTDTNCIPDLSKTTYSTIGSTNGYSYTSGDSTRNSKNYFVNNDSTSQSASATAGWYVCYYGFTAIAKYAQYYYITVPVKNFDKKYEEMAFAEPRFSRTDQQYGWTYSIPTYPIYRALNHTSCSFTNGTVYQAATCTASGWVQKKCSTCGYDYVDTLAATGHSYVDTVVAPTCTTDGYTTHTCSTCGDSYTDSVVAAKGHTKVYTDNGTNHKISCSVCKADLGVGEHEFSNGMCTLCGHVATKFLHFKTNSAEISWEWKLTDSGASKASMDGSGNGKMYATFNGSTAPSFYVDPASTVKVDHPITSGDVVQIRMRVVGYTGDATNVSPSVSFDTGSGSFGTALTGDTINLGNSDWQIVTIPISGYTGTIEQIKVAPFGDAKAAATVEIDYIYIGEPGRLPVTVTFVNYDGSVFEAYPIDMGAGVTYTGPTPTRPNENNFKYTFKGWKDSSGNVVDLNTKTFTANATLTAYYDAEYADPDHIASSKQLVDNDGNLEDYNYDLVIDAYSYGEHQTLQKNMVSPMDITIVFDRSASISFPAVYTEAGKFPRDSSGSTTNLTRLKNYLKTLDPKKHEGYYVASNFLCMEYMGTTTDPYGKGTCSYEAMKYMNNDWYVWQTVPFYNETEPDGSTFYGTTFITNPNKYTKTTKYYDIMTKIGGDVTMFVRPSSIVVNNDSNVADGITMNFQYHQDEGVLGKWVKVTEAYADFYSRIDLAVDAQDVSADMTDVYFRVGISRRGLMQDAICDFIDSIFATDSKISDGTHHKVSVVSYGYGTYVNKNSINGYTVNHNLGVSTETANGGTAHIELSSQSKVNDLKKILQHGYGFGSTYTDNAMTVAKKYVDAFKSANSKRQRVVVLLTDGSPTYGSSFEADVANRALATAANIKKASDSNAKIFSIGFMPGINANKEYFKGGTAEGDLANNFLHLVSSNAPSATNMSTDVANVNSKAGFYYSTVDGEGLANHFAMIFNQIKEEVDITTAVDSSIMLYDIIKREWDVNGEGSNSLDITVQRCDYLGNGEFAAPTTLSAGSYAVGALTEIPGTGGDRSITIEWKDAPNAWLRETPLAGQTTLGYKILVTIGIKLDRDSTIGGNNIPTNGAGSGAYYPDITNPTLKTIWEIPNVNVEPLYDYKIHDFFMDLHNPNAAIDLIRAEKNDAKTNNDIVQANMYSITQAVDGWNNNYVSIEHYLKKFTKETIIDKDGDEITTFTKGDSMVEQNLTHGTTTWSKIVYDTAFDFSKDNSLLTAGYTITPKYSGVDSLGRDPWFSKEIPVEDGIVNYYAPKYAVLDFGTKVEVPLDNEAYLDMGRMSGKIGRSDDTMSLTYNFENGKTILSEVGAYSYNVTAINTPKGASDNSVGRTFTVLPANNVMYEETYLTNDGNWVDLGLTAEELAKREERVQSENVTTEHGYDSNLHELGKSEDYSFNHAYVIEASAAKNNKTLTFSFTGTGFDVISRTGPEDGVMVVEVYTDEAMTKKADGALSINYLKDTTLYQIPVVRFMEIDADKDGDPDYGTYYVKIRAYYWDGFNPNYSATAVSSYGSARKDPAIKQVCADLGITVEELEEILAASGLSGNTKPATRNAGAAADNSYEVVVDGIRIYNPLGTVTQAAMPEAYYIYGKANELNPTFINARDALLDAGTWTFDGASDQDANGMVYIAAGGENTGSATQVSGIHLSMDGALKTKTVDGVEYLLDAAGNFVQAPGYTSNVYVRKVKNEESGRTTYNYFCKDASGNEINVTGKMKITYWNSNYDVNGPKNEIYLQYNSGVAFNVGTTAGRVMIGAKSSDGQNVFLQVYSEKDGKFVNVYAHENADGSKQEYSSNRTELYYDVTDYVTADGDVIIRNPLEKVNGAFQKGILSISGIKLLPKDGNSKMGLRAPASTVQKAVELIGNNALPEITTLDNVNLGEQLYLENDLTMVFRVKESLLVDFDLSTAYLVVEKDIYGSDGSVTVDVQILREYTVMDGRVVFTYSGISAAQMNDEIRLILHIFDSYGNEYVTEEKTTSVANYLKGLLEAMPTGQDKLYTLIMDMLNYGTAAQMYFDRHTDAPVNEAFPIFAEYASYASAGLNTALENLGGQIANEGSVAKLNQALDLGTRVGITYKVTLPEGMDPADAKLVIKDAEGKVLDTLEVAGNATDSRGRYLVTFYGSTSRDMRRVVYATVISGDAAISDTYTYSISTYAWGVYLQGGDPELIALTQAMVMYGDSAVAYFG